MPMTFNLVDHSAEILSMLNENSRMAVTAVGEKCVELTVKNMESGYGKPIRQTGDLMRSITKEVIDDTSVVVGTNIKYAPYVHEGTYKMQGRPFLKDAIEQNTDTIAELWKAKLRKGF